MSNGNSGSLSNELSYKTMNHKQMRRVYVFHLPTRFFHWLNVLAIFSLIATGYLIGNPPALMQESEASFNYWFGINRFIHFISGWVFAANWMYRIGFSFFGANKWENWRAFIPYRKCHWKEIWDIIKLDVLLVKKGTHLDIGHNRLAALTYFLLFLASTFMMMTGFALYSPMTDNPIPGWFDWVVPLLGGDMMVRFVHHSLMWLFILFTIIHVYLVLYHDYVEGRGETSSIMSGWKFIEEECLEKARREEGDAGCNS